MPEALTYGLGLFRLIVNRYTKKLRSTPQPGPIKGLPLKQMEIGNLKENLEKTAFHIFKIKKSLTKDSVLAHILLSKALPRSHSGDELAL